MSVAFLGGVRTLAQAGPLVIAVDDVQWLDGSPVDESCFHLFEAPSAEAIEEVGRQAALEHERIVEVLE